MHNASGTYTVVGLGEVLWDMLPDGKQLGGAPANFAYHAQAMGATGSVVSCVGDDEIGREILHQLEARGLDIRCVATDKQHPTGTVSVELDDLGTPTYVIHEQVAWDYLPASPGLMELAGRCSAVCFGSLAQRSSVSRETVLAFLAATPAECVRVFDINLRQSYFDAETIRDSLRLCSVLKLNDEELPVVAELLSLAGPESEVLGNLLGTYALEAVAVTRGERGSLLRTPTEAITHAGIVPSRVVDTVGAGDCFAAVLTMGLLREESLESIGNQANLLASYVCSQRGAMPSMNVDWAGT